MTGLGKMAIPGLSAVLQSLITSALELTQFLDLRDQKQQIGSLGLSEFIAQSDALEVHPNDLAAIFETLLAYRRVDAARRASPALSRVTGASLDARRKTFADRDRQKILTDRTLVKARLMSANPPVGSNAGPRKTWTEMALLYNEFSKQKRFAPVRGLLARAGRAVQDLKPCFMMSPLSLAKFLPRTMHFDLLVIDEASQMKPEDALGAMLRAKQIVVVGDAKQLPPTDFFNRSSETNPADADDDFEDVDDESILEGCQKAFREIRRLKWHYRSKCESLIAFSNLEFYDNGLITFPTAKPGSFSVDLIRVDGDYQARRNPAEASLVAQEAIRFMRHFADHALEEIPTLGIVALNIDQRDLIREELRRLSADDELVKLYREKTDNKGEDVFVKNLENVQGDERDFMFISLTRGRAPGAPAMKQQFGPINGKQGHRRLNVLFSRARSRIFLFASFGSVDVKPSETSSRGVHVLKRYLEYAETRGRSRAESIGADADSDFELEVRERLSQRGYQVDLQIGVSGFRIDLGVRHPDHPERFLAGIECDGAQYHSSSSARDRDRLREQVLVGQGWEIIRVWSTDWFADPVAETDKLVKRLEILRARPPITRDDYEIVHAEAAEGHDQPTQSVDPSSTPEIADDPPTADSSDAANPSSRQPTEGRDEGFHEKDCIKALEEFRDAVIAKEIPDWDRNRSVLRDAMIETLVRQRLVDPDDWFNLIPQFMRMATNPLEKRLYLARICEIIARLDRQSGPGEPGTTRGAPEGFDVAPIRSAAREPNNQLTMLLVPADQPASDYHPVDPSKCGETLSADRFYDDSYRRTLSVLVARIVSAEGPIYFDVLVNRIARAHGFQRSGNNIQATIMSVIDRRFPRLDEDGRLVLWPLEVASPVVIAYRPSPDRSYADVPLLELAGLAKPYLNLRMTDDEVLRSMGDHFQLDRVREAARLRFEAAI